MKTLYTGERIQIVNKNNEHILFDVEVTTKGELVISSYYSTATIGNIVTAPECHVNVSNKKDKIMIARKDVRFC